METDRRSLLGATLGRDRQSLCWSRMVGRRGGCNKHIENFCERRWERTDGQTPPALLRLPRLESLVLLGHEVVSDGVPAAMLRALPCPN